MQPMPAAAEILEQTGANFRRMGQKLEDAWSSACRPAARKLARIIQNFGDEDGGRRRPEYLGELVRKQFAAQQLTAYCAATCTQKKTASEEDGLLNTISISPQTS